MQYWSILGESKRKFREVCQDHMENFPLQNNRKDCDCLSLKGEDLKEISKILVKNFYFPQQEQGGWQ